MLNIVERRRSDEIPRPSRSSFHPAKFLLVLGNCWFHLADRRQLLVLRSGGDLNLLSIPIDVGKHDVDGVVVHVGSYLLLMMKQGFFIVANLRHDIVLKRT